MISVTYLSSAVDPFTDDQLVDLLRQARSDNSLSDVTGVLLYSGGNFIQTLEGPEDAVDEVMAKVLDDPRHAGVLVVRREAIEERDFAEWSMGFRRVAADEVEEVPGFTDYLRTGRIDSAPVRKNAAATFHRIFRRHVRDVHDWQGTSAPQD